VLCVSRRCPYCRVNHTRPSRRHSYEWALALLLLRPYRCRSCMRRFWRLTPVQWGGAAPVAARPPRPA
jgi:hypothetical protein